MPSFCVSCNSVILMLKSWNCFSILLSSFTIFQKSLELYSHYQCVKILSLFYSHKTNNLVSKFLVLLKVNVFQLSLCFLENSVVPTKELDVFSGKNMIMCLN